MLIPNALASPLLHHFNALGHAGYDLVYVGYVKFSYYSRTSCLKLFERFPLNVPAHSVPLYRFSHGMENIFNAVDVWGTWWDFEPDNLVVLKSFHN